MMGRLGGGGWVNRTTLSSNFTEGTVFSFNWTINIRLAGSSVTSHDFADLNLPNAYEHSTSIFND